MKKLSRASLPDWNNWGYGRHWVYQLLYPLSIIYGFGVALRKTCYGTGLSKVHRLPCYTISVGNVTLGGTGKTPFTISLSLFLKTKGFKVAVISRGYRRRGKGTALVSTEDKVLLTPQRAGDEPYLIATEAKVPVAVGKDRVKAFELLKPFNPDVVILDDAFQHLRIKRDLDICLVDGTRGSGNGLLFPAGPLREPFCSITRADAVVITRSCSPEVLEPCRKAFCKPVFFWSYPVKIEGTLPPKAIIITAVANVHSVVEAVKDKVEVVAVRSYPDHHLFSKKDFQGIDLPVITTLKDYIKFPKDVLKGLDILLLKVDYTLPKDLQHFLEDKVCPWDGKNASRGLSSGSRLYPE